MLSIDANVIVIFFIVWILVFLLNKFYYRPLLKIRGERHKKIEEDRLSAEQAKEEQEKMLMEIDQKIKEAQSQARQTIDELEAKALEEKERIINEVNQEYKARVEEARQKLSDQLEELKMKLAQETENLAERIKQKVLH